MKATVCDRCDKVIKYGRHKITKVKVRGIQNFNKHFCEKCFIIISNVLTGKINEEA